VPVSRRAGRRGGKPLSLIISQNAHDTNPKPRAGLCPFLRRGREPLRQARPRGRIPAPAASRTSYLFYDRSMKLCGDFCRLSCVPHKKISRRAAPGGRGFLPSMDLPSYGGFLPFFCRRHKKSPRPVAGGGKLFLKNSGRAPGLRFRAGFDFARASLSPPPPSGGSRRRGSAPGSSRRSGRRRRCGSLGPPKTPDGRSPPRRRQNRGRPAPRR